MIIHQAPTMRASFRSMPYGRWADGTPRTAADARNAESVLSSTPGSLAWGQAMERIATAELLRNAGRRPAPRARGTAAVRRTAAPVPLSAAERHRRSEALKARVRDDQRRRRAEAAARSREALRYSNGRQLAAAYSRGEATASGRDAASERARRSREAIARIRRITR